MKKLLPLCALLLTACQTTPPPTRSPSMMPTPGRPFAKMAPGFAPWWQRGSVGIIAG